MCDYSLMGVPNRLAREGEELVVYRFHTGSMGLASPYDLDCCKAKKIVRKGFWAKVEDFFCLPEPDAVCAVCIPPGARLELLEADSTETVVFIQTTQSVNTYRDAVQFAGGKILHLQGLREGLRVKVIDLSNETDFTPEAPLPERVPVLR
jgi:hypothetical protein